MPNSVAMLALALWPIVMVTMFARWRLQSALIWSILAGYMFLPEPPAGFDLPLLPPVDKHNIPAILAFVFILYRFGLRGPLLPESKLARILVFAFVLSPILTTATNLNPVAYGNVWLPGMDAKNALAIVVQQFLMLLPFLLARQFLAEGGDQMDLVRAFAIAGLIYSIPMLVEIRLSPQLHRWVYGFHQHDFFQTMRFGGWRPMVFMYHGIWVAFFTLTALVCAVAMWRSTTGAASGRWLAAVVYLAAILILAKSLGAILYALLMLPLLLMLTSRMLLRTAVVLALLATSYPLLKGAGLVPETQMLELAAQIDPDRAGSLQFRFDQETDLMDRANEKPLFGWGSYARNQFFDPRTAELVSITDGRWIIIIGVYGWVGFLAEFGLLMLPLLMLWRLTNRPEGQQIAATAAPLCLLLAINLVDLLPNSTITPITWLISGALLGHAERIMALQKPTVRMPNRIGWRPVM